MVISAHSAQYTAQKNAYKVRQISSVVGVVFLLPENIESNLLSVFGLTRFVMFSTLLHGHQF